MPGDNSRCDPARLRRYVAGELATNDETEIINHLDNCRECQHQIESLAASAAEWDDVRRLLTPDCSSPRTGWASMVANPLVHTGETHEMDFAALLPGAEARLDFLAPTDDPEMLGRLGPYEIKGLIGHGGMGLVLKAYDRALQRTVAIKVLSPHLATSATARRRFAREAQAAAAVAHDHVIAIHAVAEAGGLPYLVMPYMPGQSLQHRLDEVGPLSPVEVLRIASQIASGLAAAHAQGLVHRDIKPANILLEQGIERVAITDFGLARAIDDASLTRTGVLAGTPAYMSPEQARGETVDHRADLFSLGSVMYAMCAGRPPFRAESTIAVLKRICEEEPTPLAQLNADVPPWLVRIIARLHTKFPAERFATAADLADLLQRCLAHVQNPSSVPLPIELEEPRPARSKWRPTRPRLILAGVMLAACVALAMILGPFRNAASNDDPNRDVNPVRRAEARTSERSDVGVATKSKEDLTGSENRAVAATVKPSITEADYELLEQHFQRGEIDDPEALYQWSLRLLHAEGSNQNRSENDSLRRHLERMQRLEQIIAKHRPNYEAAARYYRTHAELEMLMATEEVVREQRSGGPTGNSPDREVGDNRNE
ncbi:MAG: serine/threonine-protein kinase [Pirellulales bacterium]